MLLISGWMYYIYIGEGVILKSTKIRDTVRR